MKINYIKRMTAFLLCLCTAVSLFSGCSGKEKKISFMYPFTASVNSYDPQVAATADEFLIIENTFEGLIRMDDDGTIKKGCADSWDISEDGLTYTFRLKHGLKWNITTERYETGDNKGQYKDKRLQMLGYDFDPEITANDFVFALRRAVSPETEAPLFSDISSIKNAVAVNSGKMKADKLGVEAVDDYTLVITLSSPDDAFMQTLTGSVAMPCNEEFFNATKGRYGLDTKYTLFNGQFYVSQILDTSYLLKKNEQYAGEYPTEISQLSLRIIGNGEDESGSKSVVSRLQNGTYDAAFITGQQSGQIDKNSGVTFSPYEDTTWAMLLNTSNEVFENETFRRAFCLGLSRLNDSDTEYLKAASNLIPSSCTIGSVSAPEQISATVYQEDRNKSVELWKQGLKETELNDISITVLTTPDSQNSLKEMLQGIQAGIGSIVKNDNGDTVNFTVKVETLEQSELDAAIAKREYDAALYPFKSESDSPITFLKSFSASNKTGFDTKDLDEALSSAESASSREDEARYINQAEQSIVDTFTIYPMLSETSYYASAKGVTGIQFHAGSGRVSFVNATRED